MRSKPAEQTVEQYPTPSRRVITRHDANPLLMGGLNLVLGGFGYLWMGQFKKGILSILICVIGGCASFGLLYAFALVTAYDAYLLGLKLQSGQSISPSENALEPLDSLFKD